ncbi:aspartyl-phosphate phosphatase Spo0E family protein [Ruminococcus sp. 5_1_39BFAA]|uniref:aspartyl-phosphate phosphatase Spo0E family protein n=1 Tax=Ruminococcus sp. 5_1_39BFAA TaxID=457412 RepID=UPI00356663C3
MKQKKEPPSNPKTMSQNQKQKLLRKIKKLQIKLNTQITTRDPLSHPQTLKLSQKLDNLINKYQNLP